MPTVIDPPVADVNAVQRIRLEGISWQAMVDAPRLSTVIPENRLSASVLAVPSPR
jgi:hypothetical protein